MEIKDLNKRFGINKDILFSAGKGNLPFVTLNNHFGKVIVSLYGAHVTSYIPEDGKEVLWLSEKSLFEPGKAIRGGIPVCWPWFGPHSTDTSLPMHGFARISLWEVIDTSITQMGELQVKLALKDTPDTLKLWAFSFSAVFTITLGRTLKVDLSVTNTGTEPFTYTDALHTYLKISDLSQITILGLKDAEFYDYTDHNILKKQEDTFLKITREENRRYINTSADCILDDQGLKRHIKVEKENSNTTVVWNPGEETARSMTDIHEGGYRNMVCIEAANAFNDLISLMPGENYSLSTMLLVE